jgi:hypothetical protein
LHLYIPQLVISRSSVRLFIRKNIKDINKYVMLKASLQLLERAVPTTAKIPTG